MRSLQRTIATVTIGVLVLAGGPRASADAPQIAAVLDMVGTWTLNGGSPLRRDDKLDAGAVIEPDRSSKAHVPWKIDIVYLGNGGKIGCRKFTSSAQPDHTKNCYLPIQLQPSNVYGDSFRQSLILAVMHFIGGDAARRFVHNIVRSAIRGGTTLRRGVVEHDADRLDIAPIMLDARPGTYTLRLRDIDQTHALHDDTDLAVTWNGTAASPSSTIPDGLYEALLLDPANANPLSDPVWVAVVPAAGYPDAERTYAEAVTITQGWGPADASSEAASSFLQAALDVAATAGTKPH